MKADAIGSLCTVEAMDDTALFDSNRYAHTPTGITIEDVKSGLSTLGGDCGY